MNPYTRRAFLREVGGGMLVAGLGIELTTELGLAAEVAGEGEKRLTFGELEPLVSLMQETEPDRLLGLLVERLRAGTSLRTLTAAGALANARTFGGQDYIGFHTFMALAPAYRMSQRLSEGERALPVLKVLYRNARRMQEAGGRASEVLHAIDDHGPVSGAEGGMRLQEASRSADVEGADRAFAGLAGEPIGEAFNHLQFAVEDEVDVHRVVLAWRGWDTRELAGDEWGHCLLRQSIRYCAQMEKHMKGRGAAESPVRALLPKLLDEYGLLGRSLGTRAGEDAWVNELAGVVYGGSRVEAATAVAAALREGWSAEAIGEAISVAANRLVLHDPGRPAEWASEGKPAGSCHGDSVGVHASDAANAWRNIVRVSEGRNIVASLIVGAFHTAGQNERSNPKPYPFAEHLAEVRAEDPAGLIGEADEAIRAGDQLRAAAAVAKYGEVSGDAGPVFELLLKFATSQDGALHAEKYFNTVVEEYATTRASMRWGQMVALARVTASEYGYKSEGYERARELMGAGGA